MGLPMGGMPMGSFPTGMPMPFMNPMMMPPTQQPNDLVSMLLGSGVLDALKGKDDDSEEEDEILQMMDRQRLLLENFAENLRKNRDKHLKSETKLLLKKIDKLEDDINLKERQIYDEERRFERILSR